MTGLVAFDVGARKHAYAACVNGKDDAGELDNSPEAIARFLARLQARCDQLRVVSTRRLAIRLGIVGAGSMRDIDQGLRFVLDL